MFFPFPQTRSENSSGGGSLPVVDFHYLAGVFLRGVLIVTNKQVVLKTEKRIIDYRKIFCFTVMLIPSESDSSSPYLGFQVKRKSPLLKCSRTRHVTVTLRESGGQ